MSPAPTPDVVRAMALVLDDLAVKMRWNAMSETADALRTLMAERDVARAEVVLPTAEQLAWVLAYGFDRLADADSVTSDVERRSARTTSFTLDGTWDLVALARHVLLDIAIRTEQARAALAEPTP